MGVTITDDTTTNTVEYRIGYSSSPTGPLEDGVVCRVTGLDGLGTTTGDDVLALWDAAAESIRAQFDADDSTPGRYYLTYRVFLNAGTEPELVAP